MKQEISHNNLPEVVGMMYEVVVNMQKLLHDIGKGLNSTEIKKEILTSKETAEYLNVTLQTLNNWAKKGKLPKKKIGGTRVGYLKKDIEKLLFEMESIK